MHNYIIRYISDKTLSLCYDTEPANNMAAAVSRFLERRPNVKYASVKFRRAAGWAEYRFNGTPLDAPFPSA